MLIQTEGDTLVIVRQTDHMAQVARIAEQWGNTSFPPPEHLEETVRAAGLHDNGWRDWEEHPTLIPTTQRPRNLSEIEPPVHAAFYGAGVERAVAIDPYTGLLVSLHAAVLYAGVEGWDPQTLVPPLRPEAPTVERTFIEEQITLQRQLRTQLAQTSHYAAAVEPARLWPAYLRLRTWDRLSLFFVYFGMRDQVLDHVPASDGETTIAVRNIGERTATVDPWPFQEDEATFPVLAVRVPDRPYSSGDEFLQVLATATPELQQFIVRRA
ncbi:MAG: DUF3891 family protein [Herpetosiphonaceae bacterium]|nr:DUF3891 family protein [Herpetosiphonaceae bacterium]